jgi:hypothetical protein
VRERQHQRAADVLVIGLVAPLQRRQRPRGAGGDDVRAQPLHPQARAGAGDPPQRPLRQPHRRQQRPCVAHALGQRRLLGGEAGREGLGIGLEGELPAHHLAPLVRIAAGAHVDAQAEAVEQLRPQVALLGVHRPHQQEAGRVAHADALALHVVHAERRRVEQQVHQVVGQQVHLVHVEHAPVGGGEQARLEGAHAVHQRPFQVQGAGDAVHARAHRQLHQPRRPQPGGRPARVGPGRAGRVRRRRVAAVRAAGHRRDRRQQARQRTHGGALGGSPLAAHQHAADGRAHGVREQRQPQLLLAHDRAEGHDGGQRASSRSPSSSR